MLYGTQLQIPELLVEELKNWIEERLDDGVRDTSRYPHLNKEWHRVQGVWAPEVYVAYDGTSMIVDSWDWTSPENHEKNVKNEYDLLLRTLHKRRSYRWGVKVPYGLSKRRIRLIVKHCLSTAITNRKCG
jgi:hypothetical protein